MVARTNVVNISVAVLEPGARMTLNMTTPTGFQLATIERDTIHPTIESIVSSLTVVDGKDAIRFDVQVSEDVFAMEHNCFCEADVQPLSNAYTARRSPSVIYKVVSCLCLDDLEMDSQSCNRTLDVDLSHALNVTGRESVLETTIRATSIGGSFYIYITVCPDNSTADDITLSIPQGALVDRAGNTNRESRQETFAYRPVVGQIFII